MSEIKVNKISPRTNCGPVQLGDSGDTITIPAGASITNSGTASGFGATGAASWNTTVKTGDFTAVAGEGYFVNTTSGAVNVTLPAGTAGAVVAIKDYAKTFDTNAVTLTRNGSDKIGGQAINATLSTEGIAVTLVFIDSTQGWLVTDDGLQSSASTAAFVTATGGTITTSGNFKIHTFTGPGTFCVSNAGNSEGSNTVDYLVVAAGGGGGYCIGGGGGAGGVRASSGAASGCYSAGPVAACVSALPVSVQGYSIVVGSGGTGAPGGTNCGNAGSVSTFSTITSAGGGGAATYGRSGNPGGSGGGAGGWIPYTPNPGTAGGSGNTPPVSPSQGNNGGSNPYGTYESSGGGGGGATAVGTNSVSSVPRAGIAPGGAGNTSVINGSTVVYGTGGKGMGDSAPGAAAGAANTGNGGDGVGDDSPGAGKNGGSGIVIIRYKFQ